MTVLENGDLSRYQTGVQGAVQCFWGREKWHNESCTEGSGIDYPSRFLCRPLISVGPWSRCRVQIHRRVAAAERRRRRMTGVRLKSGRDTEP